VIGKTLGGEKLSFDELMFFNEKMNMLPVYEKLKNELVRAHPEIRIKVSKTQISFRNRYIFALVSFQRIPHAPKEYCLVSFGLDYEKQSPRIAIATEAAHDRWTHHVIVQNENEIDDELLKWLEEAYMFSCRK